MLGDVTTDWELLEAWRNGDRKAGDILVQRYIRPIARFFRHKLREVEDDLVQRTFLGCVEGATRFEGRSSFRTFLFAIARNVLLEHLRALQRSGQRAGDEFDPGLSSLSALGPSPSQALADKQSTLRLLDALRQIPVDSQLLLELYYWEELSIAELAHVLEVPEGSVKRRLHEARQRLLHHLNTSASPSLQSTGELGTDVAEWLRAARDQMLEQA